MTASKEFYSPDEVAQLLGLHVRTVRRFIRDGKLAAARIGKQYRIAADDLGVLVGSPEYRTPAPVGRQRRVIVSSTIDIEAISREDSDRLTVGLIGAFKSPPDGPPGRRVDCIYYEEQGRLRVVVNADLDSTNVMLGMLNGILDGLPT
jgi:excisionase family DNA binding protein